jgi:hypothetical protein
MIVVEGAHTSAVGSPDVPIITSQYMQFMKGNTEACKYFVVFFSISFLHLLSVCTFMQQLFHWITCKLAKFDYLPNSMKKLLRSCTLCAGLQEPFHADANMQYITFP